MLRVLEHGGNVKLVRTDALTQAVDSPPDILKAEHILSSLSRD
jgi:CMP-2-keto-3-deoxyoctulosonic acid synthetase